MIEYLVHFLQVNVLPWGALGVFVASVAEELVAPIPSAIIMTTAGFLFVSGPVSLSAISNLIFKVAVPAAFGVTVGSYGIYFVARYGGKIVIEKLGKYIGLNWSDIEKMREKLSGTRRDDVLISVARILPIFPSVAISAFCGILEMNILKYFVISFIGIFFRGIILGVLGWQLGNVYEKYANTISSVENTILISTILAVGIFVVLKYKSKAKG